ncbi:hypothetical protein HYPSUDRAFT_197862 [Hypholoma sublateritium FD-334 SS-4]|uniref:Uncharacterized protein n=1 Tax=Hypholoma sublateritium (strain FD-334 SS-4) TaxID=945553 RepID=A0A0D2P9Z6_HYPSF|nr:hypothetical protein HYPSUDRAFT_197862 [Hypholoma sublateritium FD-334 SS-4]
MAESKERATGLALRRPCSLSAIPRPAADVRARFTRREPRPAIGTSHLRILTAQPLAECDVDLSDTLDDTRRMRYLHHRPHAPHRGSAPAMVKYQHAEARVQKAAVLIPVPTHSQLAYQRVVNRRPATHRVHCKASEVVLESGPDACAIEREL